MADEFEWKNPKYEVYTGEVIDDRGLSGWSKILTRLLDDAIRIPGTNFRVGLDGLLGLIPGVGDAATTGSRLDRCFSRRSATGFRLS
ncbi:DUF4112 domain-containing protein [Propionimicrobium lymphophilum]|uniref:DUF4112 domain-containing protein n=1 Tax=Propionimicrobium lymphophilum TaxID=33012 RepID=UPI0023F3F113|nr:DUF4112 domain-containing protein [Propionimicrobium lymphophilum]